MNIYFGAQYNLIAKGALYGQGNPIDTDKLSRLAKSFQESIGLRTVVLYQTPKQQEKLLEDFHEGDIFEFKNANDLSPTGAVILTEDDADQFQDYLYNFTKAGLKKEYLDSIPENPTARPIYL